MYIRQTHTSCKHRQTNWFHIKLSSMKMFSKNWKKPLQDKRHTKIQNALTEKGERKKLIHPMECTFPLSLPPSPSIVFTFMQLNCVWLGGWFGEVSFFGFPLLWVNFCPTDLLRPTNNMVTLSGERGGPQNYCSLDWDEIKLLYFGGQC